MEEFNRRCRSHVAAGLISLFLLLRGVSAFGEQATAFQQAYQTGTPVTLSGTLSIAVADDFAKRRSETVYAIRETKTGRSFTLRLERAPQRRLRVGAFVSLSGRAHGSNLYVAADQTQLYAQTEEVAGPMALEAAASVTAASGDQRTLVILVNFTDLNLTCTPDAVRDLMFSASSGISVDAIYRDSSFGGMSMSGGVAGPFTIAAASTDACDTGGWADAADAAAAAAGVDPHAFPRRLYVMPSSTCPAAGIADLGGTSTRAWVFACNLVDVYAHELGHNLGMNHASTPTSEYGDYSDFMSVSLGRPRQVNGAHKLQMGWVPTSQVASATQDGSYSVRPLELAPDGSMPQLLKIDSADSAGSFYVSYRRPVGVDTDLCCTYVDRLNVHRWAGGGARSLLVATLNDGETYTDPATGFSVKQLGHDDLGATARVHMGTLCAVAPTLTITPRDQSGAAAEALYDVSVSNNDGPSCPPSQFSVAGAVPTGWSSVLSQSSVQLAPSTSAQLSWRVASAANATPGSYSVSLSTTDMNTTVHSASAVGSYTVVQPCLDAPTVNLSPSNQTASSGAKVNYVIDLTNRDRAGCPATTFVLTPTVPGGWTASLSAATLTLSPGANGASTLVVTSPAAASAGTYGVWTHVSGGGNPIHDAAKSGSYIVPAGDTVPPAGASGLTATIRRKQVAVSWRPATDNVGVVGYRVLRNGVAIATTTATSWTDTAVATGVPYTYSVVAFDAAGNTSTPSNAATVTIAGGGKK